MLFRSPILKNILVTMGGVDQNNATQQILDALSPCALPRDCSVTVIMGLHAPWRYRVQDYAARLPYATKVLVDVHDMARQMANSDIAIGAAGSAAWERCCLGLPSLMAVLADNQKSAADELERAGAAYCIAMGAHLQKQIHLFLDLFFTDPAALLAMSTKGSELVDGNGVERVLSAMFYPDSLGVSQP